MAASAGHLPTPVAPVAPVAFAVHPQNPLQDDPRVIRLAEFNDHEAGDDAPQDSHPGIEGQIKRGRRKGGIFPKARGKKARAWLVVCVSTCACQPQRNRDRKCVCARVCVPPAASYRRRAQCGRSRPAYAARVLVPAASSCTRIASASASAGRQSFL